MRKHFTIPNNYVGRLILRLFRRMRRHKYHIKVYGRKPRKGRKYGFAYLKHANARRLAVYVSNK